MTPRQKTWVTRGLLAIGLGVIAWVITRFPLSAISDACLQLGPWVFVTPVMSLGWFGSSSWALYHLLGGDVPWSALLYNRIVGEGYNALIPAAGLGGEPFKIHMLSRYVDTHRAVVAVINDRFVENGIALAYSAAACAGGALVLEVEPALRATMLTYALGAGVAAVACFAVLLTTLTSRIGGRIAKWIGGSVGGHEPLPPRVLARALGWTLLARLGGILEIAVLFWLLDLDFTVWQVLFTGGAIAAAGFVGGVIPQGVGVAEAAAVGIFELLHFPGQAGVAFALARRGRQLLTSLSGVLLHVATRPRDEAETRSSVAAEVPPTL